MPDHELTDQLEPLHELPLQLEPLHELPDQDEPFQLPPDQLWPAASSAAIAAESNGMPKMSCSPWSTTPFMRDVVGAARRLERAGAGRERLTRQRLRYCFAERSGATGAVSSSAQVELAAALRASSWSRAACRSS